MNGIEDRIRRARPTQAHRGMPLDDRAERELSALLGEPAPIQKSNPGQKSNQAQKNKRSPARISRWVLAACLAGVVGTIGYQALSGDDTPAPPVAEEAPMADYPVYGSLEDALAVSVLVVLGEPLNSEAQQDDGLHFTVTDFQVNEVLFGSANDGDHIEVQQSGSLDEGAPGSSVSQYYRHLEDVESEEILLFLSDSLDGAYNPINPMDGIHGVDQGQISSLQDNDINLPETLDELREQIHQYEDTESQH